MKRFGFTDIRSNSVDSIHNNYQNIDDLRRELQGKPISEKSINAALKKVNFSKYNQPVFVHSFYPDAGYAYVGVNGKASVVISWDVKALDKENPLNLICERMETLQQGLLSVASALTNINVGDGQWRTTTIKF